jgi:hypothetical protein
MSDHKPMNEPTKRSQDDDLDDLPDPFKVDGDKPVIDPDTDGLKPDDGE